MSECNGKARVLYAHGGPAIEHRAKITANQIVLGDEVLHIRRFRRSTGEAYSPYGTCHVESYRIDGEAWTDVVPARSAAS